MSTRMYIDGQELDNEPTEKYYKDLLKYMNNMDGEEYLHYKAI